VIDIFWDFQVSNHFLKST